MTPDNHEENEQRPGYEGHWEKIFNEHPDMSSDSRRIRALIQADHNTQRSIAELRRKLGAAQWKIHRLRNATTSLLGPVLLGGIWAFFTALERAEGVWSNLFVWGAGAFGFYWLREIGKEFDDVTRD
ncbi:hypothetical protein [Sphingopyxis witflariensis]|uniref:Uncharacterized protein n=1 Tax=Sphingopyxis witflariensis TaxID=173675 RepID=A0A246JY24_9SPHN|nr:hypothetical protein [Sphingopyxis witflariensis]OWQ97994.1 hypothetical protein CDQ91_10260 [Sphingopyxis witflariensis]